MTSHPASPEIFDHSSTPAQAWQRPARHLRQVIAWAVTLSLAAVGGSWLASVGAVRVSSATDTPSPVTSTPAEGNVTLSLGYSSVSDGLDSIPISPVHSWFSVSKTASITADVDTQDYETLRVHLANNSGAGITGIAETLAGSVEFVPVVGPNLSDFVEDAREPGTYVAKLTSTKAGAFRVSVTINQMGAVTIPVKSGENDTANFVAGPGVAASVLTVTPESLRAGGTATAKVAVVDQFGNPVFGQSVTFWTSPSGLIDTPTHRVTVHANAKTGLAELPLTTSKFGDYVVFAALPLPQGDIEVTNSGKAIVSFVAGPLERPTAIPTSGATIAGQGTPGEQIVVKDVQGKVIGEAVVKADGSWTTDLVTPAKEGDLVSIRQINAAGHQSEPLVLRIGLIRIALDESKIHSLELQVATVCNLQPGERVTLTLHSESVSMGWRVADDHGHAIFSFLVPTQVGLGRHHISAVGEVSGLVESDYFEVFAPPGEPTATALPSARSTAKSSRLTATPNATITLTTSATGGNNYYQGLPDTGSEHLLPVVGLAGSGLLVGVILMVVSARRRQRVDLQGHTGLSRQAS